MRSINAALRGHHSVAASIKRPGTEQSGPDPIHRAASTGILGYSLIHKEYGCSRLFIPDIKSTGVLGF